MSRRDSRRAAAGGVGPRPARAATWRGRLPVRPTAGAAHTYELFELGSLQVAIPTGRPVSPLSGGNWEGSGVRPDHRVPAAEALAVALRLAGLASSGSYGVSLDDW